MMVNHRSSKEKDECRSNEQGSYVVISKYGKKDLEAVDDFSPGYKRNRADLSAADARSKQLLANLRCIPDIQVSVEEMIAEGDWIPFRSTMAAPTRRILQYSTDQRTSDG
jgi:predicted ester cyclase